MPDNIRKFHLGLCMVGSITVNAYTAESWLEALENWESVRENHIDFTRQNNYE